MHFDGLKTNVCVAAVAHEVVGQARNEEERWKSFLQLHAALQELKRRQQKKKKGSTTFPSLERRFLQISLTLILL